uniref:Ribosomal RNA large subunit methyltransferase K/L-like methyltransferase domain-containing protein n=2 Tax=Lotharella globosa TaxID=91324 RepID=A0A7S3YV64_9EUKA|mmetsp:Transcript_18820/g.36108  ORF Transcript_18820/g.36108 Transcript_18820/m.36108 type:complete len:155 (-) Transcript_18820:232-696(-)
MCYSGTGAIGVYAAITNRMGQYYFLSDSEQDCVNACLSNSGRVVPGRCSVARCDATRMPIRSAIFDAIVTDAPFGHRCGNKNTIRKMYPKAIQECHRLLRPGGVFVWMTSVEETDLTLKSLEKCGLVVIESRLVFMGHVCSVVVARKNISSTTP